MSSNFPTSLDTYTTKQTGDTIAPSHINNPQDAIEAIEVKVGADSSSYTTSHDYKIQRLEDWRDQYVRASFSTSGEGGSQTSGSWQTYPLTIKDEDSASLCTLSSNQFSLATGTWEIRSAIYVAGGGRTQSRLRNISDSSTEIVGTNSFGDVTYRNATHPEVRGRFTIAARKTFEIQYYTNTSYASYGLGYDANTGEINVYGVVELWRVSY